MKVLKNNLAKNAIFVISGEMLSYEAWTDGRTAVCHNKPVFWRAYTNEWPISWNYEYSIFGQIIFQNFHQFKAFVGLSDCRTIGLSDYRTVGLSDCRTIGLSDYSYGPKNLTEWILIMIILTLFRIWAIHFYTPVKIRAYYDIPLFVRPSTPRTITSLTCSPFYW
jgi:hypothetical protein